MIFPLPPLGNIMDEPFPAWAGYQLRWRWRALPAQWDLQAEWLWSAWFRCQPLEKLRGFETICLQKTEPGGILWFFSMDGKFMKNQKNPGLFWDNWWWYLNLMISILHVVHSASSVRCVQAVQWPKGCSSKSADLRNKNPLGIFSKMWAY